MKKGEWKTKISGVLMVALLLLFAGCSDNPEGTSSASGSYMVDEATEEPPRVAVEALEISKGNILQKIEASGTVEGINEATVVSETQGIITFADFELGEYVEAGQALAGVDASIAELSYQEALGANESAQLDLSATQRRYEGGSASQAELMRARSAANGAQARLRSAEKAYRDSTVRAPISGYVASRGTGITVGNYLQPGVAVARLVDLSSLKLEFGVGEQELRYLKTGMDVRITVSACGQDNIPAQVESIAAGADERTGSFPVVVQWENTCGENARSGISASVVIETGADIEQLIIPSAAIRTIGGLDYVFVVTGEVVEQRQIEVGDRLGDRVQVVRGISEGDVIVVSALTTLSDGSPVEASIIGRTGDVL